MQPVTKGAGSCRKRRKGGREERGREEEEEEAESIEREIKMT